MAEFMRELPVVRDLPVSLYREIGRVMVAYSFLEYQLSRVIYDLLGVGPKQGRLAIREPRGTDRLELIFELVDLAKISLQADRQLLRDAVQAAQTQRDQLAHGIWLRDRATKTLFLRLTKGSWQPVKGQRGKTKRTLNPEGIEYSADDARTLTAVTNETISAVDALHEEILAALKASLEKSLSQQRS